jgi:F420-dependent oxidoreductase-like protein
MRLGLGLGYTGSRVHVDVQAVQDAERLGYHSVWTAEAYGSDAVVPLAWIGALTYRIRLGTGILQMAARTPAMTAMTAMTLDALSGRRALLGLGVSGPQVVEGWHGQPFGKPLGRTREYVSIVRAILGRQRPLEHAGEHYQIPYRGPDATGLGKPLRSIVHGRPDLPIYLAAIGPRNVALAAEIADGWLPVFYSPWRAKLFEEALAEGFARAGAPEKRERFDVAPMVPVIIGRDVDACRAQVKPRLALYVGGMGARGRNFYFDLACRYGYEAAAAQIQELYLAGRRPEAEAAVPDALVDEIALCGPPERIRERLSAWRDAGVTTLVCGTAQPEAIRLLAELVL